jgi:valyl-tRNA synthetase
MIDTEVEEIGDKTVDVISAVRKYKTLNKKALNAQVSRILLKCDEETKEQLKGTYTDLKATLHVAKIESGDAGVDIITEKYGLKLEIEF